jgi:hypothetical protein
MNDKSVVSAENFSGIVNLGKSKRLAGMRVVAQKVEKKKAINKVTLSTVEQARLLIDQTIKEIKQAYPEGKRNSLLNLRYASEQKIAKMAIGEVFKLLQLEDKKFKKVLVEGYKK